MRRSILSKTSPWPRRWSTTRPFCAGTTAPRTPRVWSSAPGPSAMFMRRAGPAPRREEGRKEPKASGRTGRQTKCRRPDLADGQAAVAWRYEPVCQYPEPALLQQQLCPFGETPVQKAAAGQHHRFLSCPPGDLEDALGQGIMKVG